MTDLRTTIEPKSDQLNADDLIGGARTITVSKVSLCKEADQPIAVNFEGDNGKPYKPCKSMRRVMVSIWGPDGNAYPGRSMTLYRDDKVTFGAMAVGGIRISHMSHIDKDVTMALTATRASRKPFTVRPLKIEAITPPPKQQMPPDTPSQPQDDAIPLSGEVSDYADALEHQLDQAADRAARVGIFNAAIKTKDWMALKAADEGRCSAIKARVVAE